MRSINTGVNIQGLPNGLSQTGHFGYPAQFDPHFTPPQIPSTQPAHLTAPPNPTDFTGSGDTASSPSVSSQVGNGSPFTHNMGLDPEELEEMMDTAGTSSGDNDRAIHIDQLLSGAGKSHANPLILFVTPSHRFCPTVPSDTAKPIIPFSPSLDGSRTPFTAEECRELSRLAAVHSEERIIRRYGPPDSPVKHTIMEIRNAKSPTVKVA